MTLLITSFVYMIGAILYIKLLQDYRTKKQSNQVNSGVKVYLKDIKNGWLYFSKNKGLLYIGLSACVVTPFFSAIVLYIIIGFFIGNVKVLSKSLVYKYVHESFIGRIMTLISMFGLTLGIVISFIIGYIGEKIFYILTML